MIHYQPREEQKEKYMAILRWIMIFMVSIVILTQVFGQEDPNFPKTQQVEQEAPKKKSLIGSIFKSFTGEDVLAPPPSGNELLIDENALASDEALLNGTPAVRAATQKIPSPAPTKVETPKNMPQPQAGSKSFAIGDLKRVPKMSGGTTPEQAQLQGSAAAAAAAPAELSDDMLENVLREMQAEGLEAQERAAERVPAEPKGMQRPMPEVAPEPYKPQPIQRPVLAETDETGLPVNLWQNTDSSTILSLLNKIEPTPYSAPMVVDIMERLMLSDVPAPEGLAPSGMNEKRWKVVRANTLIQQGLAGAATTLVERMASPESIPVDAGVPELWVQTRLLKGDTSVCTYVQEMIPNVDTIFWKHALWTCQAMKGDKAGLKLSLNISKKVKDASDVMTLLDDYLSAEEGDNFILLDSGRRWSPLSQALLAHYPERLTENHMDQLSDVSLRTIATNTRAPMETRLYSVERLVNSYGKTADGLLLLQLYEAQQFDKELMKHALQRVEDDVTGSRARALLWQAAEKERLSSERALILKKLWGEADKDGLDKLSVVLSPDKRRIQPDVKLAWFAPHVIQSSLNSGNVALARQWMTVLKGNETLSQSIKKQRADVNVLFEVMDGKLTAGSATEWTLSQPAARNDDVVRLLTLLEALGVAVDESVWLRFDDTLSSEMHTEETGALWLRLLGSSLNSGRTGESMLRALVPLSKRSPDQLGTNTLANVTSAFRLMGMQEEARKLFVSAAVAEMKIQ